MTSSVVGLFAPFHSWRPYALHCLRSMYAREPEKPRIFGARGGMTGSVNLGLGNGGDGPARGNHKHRIFLPSRVIKVLIKKRYMNQTKK